MLRLAVGLLSVVALAGTLTGCGGSETRTLVVNATGHVKAVPDRVAFEFTVTSRGPTAASALAANTPAANRVVAALRANGVRAADIQTTNASLDQVLSQSGTTVTGYTATSSVSATIRGVSHAGSVVDAAVAAGANGVQGPTLLSSTQDALYQRALRRAVEQARGKAQALADSAGERLGPVISIVEGGSAVPLSTGVAESAAKIQPGTTTTEANVTATFRLR